MNENKNFNKMIPQQCCLACSVKHYGIGESFIAAMLDRGKRVLDFYNLNDQEIDEMINSMLKPTEKIPVLQLVQMLVETHGMDKAPLLHDGYYQKELLQACATIGVLNFNFGMVGKGQVLELLYQTAQEDTVETVLDNMFAESQEYVECDRVFKGLVNVSKQTAVYITAGSSAVRINWTGEHIKLFKELYEYNGCKDLELLLERYLTPIESVSVMMVQILNNVVDERIVSLCFWMNAIGRIFGDSKKMTIVFAVDCSRIVHSGVANRNDILQVLNKNVASDMNVVTKYAW